VDITRAVAGIRLSPGNPYNNIKENDPAGLHASASGGPGLRTTSPTPRRSTGATTAATPRWTDLAAVVPARKRPPPTPWKRPST
jgi:hypothetical protein